MITPACPFVFGDLVAVSLGSVVLTALFIGVMAQTGWWIFVCWTPLGRATWRREREKALRAAEYVACGHGRDSAMHLAEQALIAEARTIVDATGRYL